MQSGWPIIGLVVDRQCSEKRSLARNTFCNAKHLPKLLLFDGLRQRLQAPILHEDSQESQHLTLSRTLERRDAPRAVGIHAGYAGLGADPRCIMA